MLRRSPFSAVCPNAAERFNDPRPTDTDILQKSDTAACSQRHSEVLTFLESTTLRFVANSKAKFSRSSEAPRYGEILKTDRILTPRQNFNFPQGTAPPVKVCSSQTFHRNVWEGEFCSGLLKGEAVLVASPRNAFAFLTPCSVFLVIKGGFALCGGRQGGAAPLTPASL